jgi:hypothetical protein
MQRFPWVEYIKRENFKEQFLKSIDDKINYMALFGDDNIFCRKFDTADGAFSIFDNDSRILALSLSLGRNTIFHPDYGEMKLPKFDCVNRWEWYGASVDFGYPMLSALGNIYHTNDIKEVLKQCELPDVPYIEPEILKRPISKPMLICYEESRVFENALNQVITEWENPHGNITAEYLNEQFLNGKQLKNIYDDYKNKTCHEIIGIELEERT